MKYINRINPYYYIFYFILGCICASYVLMKYGFTSAYEEQTQYVASKFYNNFIDILLFILLIVTIIYW